MKINKTKKIIILFIIILFAIGLLCGLAVGLSRKNRENWITDYEYLYSKAIEYIEKEQKENGKDREEQDYQVFTDYEGFRIEEDDNKKYVYMWILEETYYVKNEKLFSSEGSSMAYKFTFENNEVVNYEIPKDGSYYASSIKEMFPDSIEDKILNYTMDDSKLKSKVKEYYSYLDSTEIIYVDTSEENKEEQNETNEILQEEIISKDTNSNTTAVTTTTETTQKVETTTSTKVETQTAPVQTQTPTKTETQTTQTETKTQSSPTITGTDTSKELTNTETKYGVVINTYTTTIYNVYSDGSKTVKSTSTSTEYDQSGYSATTSELLPEAKQLKSSNAGLINGVLSYVNQYRQEANTNAVDGVTNRENLTLDTNLTVAACARAMELAYADNFSHTRPNGSSCFTILKEMGISYMSCGENIAYGQSSAQSVSSAWKNSSGHYSNMIDSNFTKIGIGVINFRGTYYWVQLFTN